MSKTVMAIVFGMACAAGSAFAYSNQAAAVTSNGTDYSTIEQADSLLGITKISKEDALAAIAIYEQAVEENGEDAAVAAYKLGEIYLKGQYVGANYETAMKYFSIAASKGYAPAQMRLQNLIRK